MLDLCFFLQSIVVVKHIGQNYDQHQGEQYRKDRDLLYLIQIKTRQVLKKQVLGDELGRIIEKMRDNGNGQVAGPIKQIAQQRTQEHPGQETLKLKMKPTKNNGRDPNG